MAAGVAGRAEWRTAFARRGPQTDKTGGAPNYRPKSVVNDNTSRSRSATEIETWK